MKRTYVDIIGEYYDHQDDVVNEAYNYGVRDVDLKKVLLVKHSRKKRRVYGEE